MSLHCCTALIIVVARTVVAGTGVHLVIRAKQAATSWRCCHSQTPNQTCQTRAKADYKPQEESSSSVQQLLVVVGTTSTVLTPDVLYYTLLYPTTVLLTLERLTLDAAASATTSNQTSSIKPHHHIHTSHNAFTHLHRPLLLFLPVATPDYQLIVSRLPPLSQPASQSASIIHRIIHGIVSSHCSPAPSSSSLTSSPGCKSVRPGRQPAWPGWRQQGQERRKEGQAQV